MRKHIKSSAGFSLIELMVGALIGLIATVIIFQMFAVSESQKRATTGAGDSLQAGNQALFQLERDVSLAGFGLSKHLFGCTINGWYDTGVPGGQLLKFTLVPVIVKNGLGNLSDSITVFSGSADKVSIPTGLYIDQPTPATEYSVLNPYGFNPGDLTVAINYKTTVAADKECTLAQVTSVTDSDVFHIPGTYVYQGLTKTAQFNRPGGLPAPANVTYKRFLSPTKGGGLLFNIGRLPRILTYRVIGTDLVMGNEFMPAGTPIVVAENVVQFQVQYAIDGGDPMLPANTLGKSDGIFNMNLAPPLASNLANMAMSTAVQDHWANDLPALPAGTSYTPEQWSKILAVRMAIVTKGEYVQPKPGQSCDATTANPKWTNAGNVDLDISGVPNWQCYRYKVQEMTVPLRNITWAPSELGIMPPKPEA